MAVVDYRVNGIQIGLRNFEVPKRASSLKHWYRSAHRALPSIPPWQDSLQSLAEIDEYTIIFEWEGLEGAMHLVTIARKRRL